MIRGAKVELRSPTADDGPALLQLRNDVATQLSLMTLPRAHTARRCEKWIEDVLADPQSLFFVIATVDSATCQGFIQLRNIRHVHGTAELGIALAAEARGQGYGLEAVQLLERYAADVFNLRKITLQVLAENEAAIAIYQRLGYQRVGVLQQHHYQHRQYRDVLIMEHLLQEGEA